MFFPGVFSGGLSSPANLSIGVLAGLVAAAVPGAGAGRGHHHRHSPMPRWLIHLGLPGLFVLAVLDSSPLPLPLPGSTDLLLLLLVAQKGSHPVWLGLTAVAGSLLGGYLTWSAGRRGGQAMLERWAPKRLVAPLKRWVTERGWATVAVSALLPPPVPLMPLLLGAGALGVSRGRFLAGLGGARVVRYGVVVWVGVTYGRRVLRLWNLYLADWSGVILWSFLGLLVAGIGFGVWQYRRTESGTGRPGQSAFGAGTGRPGDSAFGAAPLSERQGEREAVR